MIDRLTGEVLPDIPDFKYYEVGWGDNEDNFRRNTITEYSGITRWRNKYENTGVYRSLYSSNTQQMLSENPNTLYYGNLCFDMDGPKTGFETIWIALVTEIEQKLIPKLKADFNIPETAIHIWFSGGRGFHIEVPAKTLGIWPHHDLARIHGYYARQIREELDLQFFDASLYGLKRLYRLEYSRHQRSSLYKQPLAYHELAAVRDDFSWMKRFSQQPRKKQPGDLFTAQEPTSKSLGFYAMIAQQALNSLSGPKTRSLAGTSGNLRTRQNYDRSWFKCMETLMSPGYIMNTGGRNTMAFFFSRHLRDGGFSYDEAYEEMEEWATNHCDPPMVSLLEKREWENVLERAYRDGSPGGGCTYIQNNFPSLCVGEQNCPVGRLKLSQKTN